MPNPAPVPAAPALDQAHVLDAGPYGALQVLTRPDPATGRLRCHVTGLRLQGVFVVEPGFRANNPDPDAIDRLRVSYGDLPAAHFHDATQRPHRPVLYGTVTLVEHSFVTIANVLAGARTPYDLGAVVWRTDPVTGPHAVDVPYGTGRHVAAVLVALTRHWLARPDVGQLRLAAVRHDIRERDLISRQAGRVVDARKAITEAQQQLEAEQNELRRLRELIGYHPYPDRRPPAGAADDPPGATS